MGIIDVARQVKHRAFVASKHARWAGRDARLWVDDRRWALAERLSRLVYDEGRYPHTFLTRPAPDVGPTRETPAILWACWLGGPITPNRERAIEGLRQQPGLEFRLVTEPAEVLVDGHPFHYAYEHLTMTQKSDYMRAYVMHHHGGFYADVKPFLGNLRPAVDRLNADPDLWVVAYREITSNYVPDLAHTLGQDIRRHYRSVMGPSGFACRPGTLFTAEWLREVDARMDYYSGQLAEAAAGAGDAYERPASYPIRWSEIMGDITQPLSMKHQGHVLFTDEVRPALKDYR